MAVYRAESVDRPPDQCQGDAPPSRPDPPIGLVGNVLEITAEVE